MNSEILFIFDMVVTLIFAVVAVRSFDGMLKRLFIPFMSVFFSVLNGYLQLFADYFYISSRRITQNKDAVHHYSSKFYSSNFFEGTEFVNNLYIISTYEQFERFFLNNNGSYFWNTSNKNKNVIGKCFADMLKETEKYDEAFFSEYVLMDSNLEKINSRLTELQEELLRLANEKKSYSAVAGEIDALREQREKCIKENAAAQGIKQRIECVRDFLKSHSEELEEYDEQLTRLLIESIMVYEDRLLVEFKSGTQVEIKRK